MQFQKYNIERDYQWNYDNVPAPLELEMASFPGRWNFCGLPVDSPLGVPAGPLLNGRWVLYYASLGYDVLTYKTVRSVQHACYDVPNLTPVVCDQLSGNESRLPVAETMQGSWAVSFGMPSTEPAVWRDDIRRTRELLPPNKVLSVSVVGTARDNWSLDQLADDYAQCARWALESGADTIETNFSCPNVSTRDGQLYQQADAAALVASRVREYVPEVPFAIKVGHISADDQARELLQAVAPFVDAIAITNSIATTVVDSAGQLVFGGQRRGICGDGTRTASVDQTKRMARIINAAGFDIQLIGVGGASRMDHVQEYLNAGAHAVQIATAAMVRPETAMDIRRAAGSTDPTSP